MIFKRFNPIVKSLLFFFLAVLIVRILGDITSFPDTIYRAMYSWISKQLVTVSSFFSISIGDLFYTVLFTLVLVFLIQLVRNVVQRSYGEVRKKLVRMINFFTILYLLFNLIWGFNYYKTPIKDSYDMDEISVGELKSLAEMYWLKSVLLRSQVHEDSAGVFRFDLAQSEFNKELEKNAEKVEIKYAEIKLIRSTRPNLKKSLYSTMFSYLGVAGYFIPFTGEAQYNGNLPDTKRLFTELHECSHQWGFAPENEANFVAFLLAEESDRIDFQYVANFKAMRSILNKILWVEPQYVKEFLERYSPGMKRDRENEIAVARKYYGKGDDAFSMMNEAFLRINNQEGLESYGRFVELLVGYNRKYILN